MLINQIQQDMISARREKDWTKAALLSLVLSEANKIGKDKGNRPTTEEETIQVVKKMVANNDESIKLAAEKGVDLVQYKYENSVLSQYLPKQMTEDELRQAITQYIETENVPKNPKSMGIVMKWLNATFSGQFDGKTASMIVKSLLG